MARLQFDGASGWYVGTSLIVAGYAMSRRIRLLTDALTEQGIDAVDAAEAAWNTALDEGSWDAGQDDVRTRPALRDGHQSR